ncbi:lytic murein transglycosylase [Frankia sp. Cpl3]|uniref:lytic transglycosylase domain-containing protein n=1 Tax=Parafrankia colletiae TaxID=573497 RepID=UPI000B339A0A|nr:lytic transglycosylase domain-containing protein [Parafrankia colletiae]MCK9905018.1 lytic murein transglycosylase [Frankia sp. Cpl3]
MLPAILATGLMLFCAAGAPRGSTGQHGPTGSALLRPGDWTMPDLVPGRSGGTESTDPSALTTETLAATATAPTNDSSAGPAITLTVADRGIPARVLTAYKEATDRLAQDKPDCHLPWELLAAIGKIESGHGTGRPITDDGTITPPILGPPLNGTGNVALIRDTDNGTLDHDTTYDRAVGPMQFIPTTWRTSGRDGSGDGRNDPHNIFDATLAAGHYLCAAGRDLNNPDQLRAAIYSYNPSDAYVRTVLTWLSGYRQGGAAALPSGPSPTTPPPPDQPSMPAPPGTPAATTSPPAPAGTATPTPTTPTPARTLPGVTIIPLTPREPSPTPSAPTRTSSPEPSEPPRTSPTPVPTPTPTPSDTAVPSPVAQAGSRESSDSAVTATTIPPARPAETPTTSTGVTSGALSE